MNIQLQPNKRESIFLIAGILLGIGSVGLITGGRFYNVVHTKGTTLYSWPGPSVAKESVRESVGDGTPGGWMMAMTPYGQIELEAKLVDSNQDGKYDTCATEIRPGGQAADGYLLALVDSDNNGSFDGMQVSNTGLKGTRYVDYRDWNLDGFLDLYIDKVRSTSWIATGTEWLKVIKRIETEDRAYLVERNGEERVMAFRDETWVDITPVQQN